MATTSGAVKFDPAIDDIIEEAFERCGVQSRSGYDIFTVRRSLNLLFSEWGNRNLLQFKINFANVDLVQDQNFYDFAWDSAAALKAVSPRVVPAISNANHVIDLTSISNTPLYNVDDVLSVSYRNISSSASAPTDTTMTKIDRSAFAALATKKSTGTPSQFMVQRFELFTRLWIYLTPGSAQASNYLYMWYVSRIDTNTAVGSYSNTADVIYRYYPAMCAGLAYYLSLKIKPDRTQALKLYYEDEILRAEIHAGSESSTYITPKAYYPSVT